MKTPKENPDGYAESAVVKMDGFKNGNYLLMHGLADGSCFSFSSILYNFVDNVHFQNSADLVWHLTRSSVKNYEVHYFTDSDHSISAGGAYHELMDFLRKFLFKKFKME